MATNKESKGLVKKDWAQSFNLVGEAKISDFTYKIDEKAKNSDWVYNSLNLGVNCGEKSGDVYCELMGGYGSERDNVIYVHGKKEDGTDDFDNRYTIAWEDRFDEDILQDIGDLCFISIGLEKDSHNKTFRKDFLTPYDAIAYVQEHLEEGMVINVRGQLKYTVYNGNLQCRKEINSIFLSSVEPKDYKAVFTQSILIDKNSCTKDSLDKNKSVLNIYAYVLEKFKEFNGYDLTNNGKIKGGQLVPLSKVFEFPVDISTEQGKAICKSVMTQFFKVKKGVTQITFIGEFVETGATIKATEDDLTDDVKQLIAWGMYTLEDALAQCTINGNRERRMLIVRPMIKTIENEDGTTTSIIQKFDERFTEDDLVMECLTPKEEADDEESEKTDDDLDSDSDSWLNMI